MNKIFWTIIVLLVVAVVLSYFISNLGNSKNIDEGYHDYGRRWWWHRPDLYWYFPWTNYYWRPRWFGLRRPLNWQQSHYNRHFFW